MCKLVKPNLNSFKIVHCRRGSSGGSLLLIRIRYHYRDDVTLVPQFSVVQTPRRCQLCALPYLETTVKYHTSLYHVLQSTYYAKSHQAARLQVIERRWNWRSLGWRSYHLIHITFSGIIDRDIGLCRRSSLHHSLLLVIWRTTVYADLLLWLTLQFALELVDGECFLLGDAVVVGLLVVDLLDGVDLVGDGWLDDFCMADQCDAISNTVRAKLTFLNDGLDGLMEVVVDVLADLGVLGDVLLRLALLVSVLELVLARQGCLLCLVVVMLDLADLSCSLLGLVLCWQNLLVLQWLDGGVVVVLVTLLIDDGLLALLVDFCLGLMLDCGCDLLLDCGVFFAVALAIRLCQRDLWLSGCRDLVRVVVLLAAVQEVVHCGCCGIHLDRCLRFDCVGSRICEGCGDLGNVE
jgi:hypothetical protein